MTFLRKHSRFSTPSNPRLADSILKMELCEAQDMIRDDTDLIDLGIRENGIRVDDIVSECCLQYDNCWKMNNGLKAC